MDYTIKEYAEKHSLTQNKVYDKIRRGEVIAEMETDVMNKSRWIITGHPKPGETANNVEQKKQDKVLPGYFAPGRFLGDKHQISMGGASRYNKRGGGIDIIRMNPSANGNKRDA